MRLALQSISKYTNIITTAILKTWSIRFFCSLDICLSRSCRRREGMPPIFGIASESKCAVLAVLESLGFHIGRGCALRTYSESAGISNNMVLSK